MLDLFLREKLPVGEGEERICPKVPAYVRRSQFRLPNRAQVGKILHFYFQLCLQTPVIMIGPGTGLAPFRGFIQVCLLFIFGGYVDIVRTCASGACLAEGERQDSWTDRSFLRLQEQGPGLHLQVGRSDLLLRIFLLFSLVTSPLLPGKSWRLGSRMACSHSTLLSVETR